MSRFSAISPQRDGTIIVGLDNDELMLAWAWGERRNAWAIENGARSSSDTQQRMTTDATDDKGSLFQNILGYVTEFAVAKALAADYAPSLTNDDLTGDVHGHYVRGRPRMYYGIFATRVEVEVHTKTWAVKKDRLWILARTVRRLPPWPDVVVGGWCYGREIATKENWCTAVPTPMYLVDPAGLRPMQTFPCVCSKGGTPC